MEKQFTYTHADFVISVIAEDHNAAFKAAHDVRFKQLIDTRPMVANDGKGLVYLYDRAFYGLVDAVVSVAQVMDRPSYLQSIMVAGL